MKKLILTFILGLLMITSVSAITMRGIILSPIIYEPGKIITNHYTVTNTQKDYELSLGGSLTEYMTLENQMPGSFDLVIRFPEQIPETGEHIFTLSALEVSNQPEGQISALLSVGKVFKVIVHNPEKEIKARINANNVNLHQPINFHVTAVSASYQNIDSVKAEITVFDINNNTLGSLRTDEKPVQSLQSVNLKSPPFPTNNLAAGKYQAEVTIFYDGKIAKARTNFNIGSMDLVLENYTSNLEQGFSEFKAKIRNDWNQETRNVYAKLFVGEQEILQTPTVNKIQPWDTIELKSIAKIDLPLGTHNGELKIFYTGGQKNAPIQLKILPTSQNQPVPELQKPKKTNFTQYAIIGLIILILVIILSRALVKRRMIKDDF